MEDQRRTNSEVTIFVDADAFVALARADDANHEHALFVLRQLSQQPVKLFTSNYVFAESVTVISQRVSHDAALSYINEIKSPQSSVTVHWITEALEEQALRIFAEQTSKNVSLVDCTNMVLVAHYKIDYIFSFDSVYQRSGYHMVQELVEQ